jgi:hypothetical protein
MIESFLLMVALPDVKPLARLLLAAIKHGQV